MLQVCQKLMMQFRYHRYPRLEQEHLHHHLLHLHHHHHRSNKLQQVELPSMLVVTVVQVAAELIRQSQVEQLTHQHHKEIVEAAELMVHLL